MNYYDQNIVDCIEQLKSDSNKGLTSEEVATRLEKNGKNELVEGSKHGLIYKFLMQFKDVMIIILLIAAFIAFFVAVYEKDKKGFIEPFVILGIVLLNALLGVFQENKAEKALEALRKMSSPKIKVLRDGEIKIVDSDSLVNGDIIYLEAGDVVPADARLIESYSLKCDESSLTGESLPVEKNALDIVDLAASLGDRTNMVYSSSNVNYGRAVAVVSATGMSTEMGKIASLLNKEKSKQTPLQEKLAKMGKILGIVALSICAVIFVIGIFVSQEQGLAKKIMHTFMMAVSLAVAAIPEGLPTIVTISLALGVQTMVKRNAIIRKLPAVETLGSASIICSDKTGTLTQNKMQVQRIFEVSSNTDYTHLDSYNTSGMCALTYATLCCDGEVREENGKIIEFGDPTETSIVALSYKKGNIKSELEKKYKRVKEIPFDSDRKLMTTVNEIEDKLTVIIKGAPDVLLNISTNKNKEEIVTIVENMSKQALRVIAVAIKQVDDNFSLDNNNQAIEKDVHIVGLIGMIDPPRAEAKEAVTTCIKAGIKPIMITGDHITTAKAIARKIGIFNDGDKAIIGSDLEKLTDEELFESLKEISVYARVSPKDKIRIVKAWQTQGDVVAMTGDGVNDAPALKAADIGCAMGITGTDVAKNASDMTIMDDNFATIVKAVEVGRGIYDNIIKSVQFLLSCNVGEIITVFLAIIIWKRSPFLAMQLLWINLVTDSLPALALSMENPDRDIMTRKPRSKNEGVFANKMGYSVILHGMFFGAITLIAYAIGDRIFGGEVQASAMAFAVLSISQLFHAFNSRSRFSIFKVGVFSNKYMIGAFVISFALVLVALFVPPIATMLGLSIILPKAFAISIALSLSPIVLVEIEKAIAKIIKRKKEINK